MNDKLLERQIHNLLMARANGEYSYQDFLGLKQFYKDMLEPKAELPRYKVALLFICLNPRYWEFAKEAILGAKQYFLPGHDVEYLIWSDIARPDDSTAFQQAEQSLLQDYLMKTGQSHVLEPEYNKLRIEASETTKRAREAATVAHQCKVIPTGPMEWPYPTLMRYHLFLNQKKYLKKFDYVFYCDLDMRFVNIVGDEILGQGLTAAQHPMYALRKEYNPPYEPNPLSESYIPRPGRVLVEGGKPRFQPLYFAGGLQGGRAKPFIEAMEKMKKMIDSDLGKNYIPIWNDETAWNKYLFLNPPSVVLDPSYIYPDSLIEEYYKPVWGRNYTPRLVTLTKKFSISREGGEAARRIAEETKNLR